MHRAPTEKVSGLEDRDGGRKGGRPEEEERERKCDEGNELPAEGETVNGPLVYEDPVYFISAI